MRLKVIFLAISSLILICGACSRAPKDSSVESLFQIEFGELGGAAGNFTGYIIEESGAVLKLIRSPGGEPAETPAGTISKEKLNTLFEAIEIYDIFNTEYQRRGNMTFTLKIRKETKEHSVHWPVGDENVPEGLSKFHSLLNDVIGNLK